MVARKHVDVPVRISVRGVALLTCRVDLCSGGPAAVVAAAVDCLLEVPRPRAVASAIATTAAATRPAIARRLGRPVGAVDRRVGCQRDVSVSSRDRVQLGSDLYPRAIPRVHLSSANAHWAQLRSTRCAIS